MLRGHAEAVVAAASGVATAAVGIAIGKDLRCPVPEAAGRGCRIRGNSGRVNGVQDLSQTSVSASLDLRGLRTLRRGQLGSEQLLVERGDLRVLRGNLLLGKLVQHSAGVVVLVGDDVPRHGLHGIPGVAGLGAYVVVDSAQSLLGVAATTGNLSSQRVLALQRGNGLRVESLLNSGAKSVDFASGVILLVADGGVEVREPQINGVRDTGGLAHEVVEVVVDTGLFSGQCALSSRAVHTAAVAAEAVAKAAPSPSEDEEQDNQPRTIATPHAGIVIATIPRACGDVGRRHRINGERHCISPLIKIFL